MWYDGAMDFTITEQDELIYEAVTERLPERELVVLLTALTHQERLTVIE